VRRAKLYYLRDRVGKRARVRERRYTGPEQAIEPGLLADPQSVQAGGATDADGMTAEDTVLEGAAATSAVEQDAPAQGAAEQEATEQGTTAQEAAEQGAAAADDQPDADDAAAAAPDTGSAQTQTQTPPVEDAAGEGQGQGGSDKDEIAAGDESQGSVSAVDVSSDAGEDTPQGASTGDSPA
jgi:hypothetical protein